MDISSSEDFWCKESMMCTLLNRLLNILLLVQSKNDVCPPEKAAPSAYMMLMSKQVELSFIATTCWLDLEQGNSQPATNI